MKEYITKSEEETLNLAKSFGEKLKKDTVICLTGDLGTGKTRFVRGIAEYFGIANEVSSPTFTIVNEYITIKNNSKIKKIFHFDVYRLSGADDFYDTIGMDYFKEGPCILEWGEIVKDILPKNTIYVKIQIGENETERIFKIEGEI